MALTASGYFLMPHLQSPTIHEMAVFPAARAIAAFRHSGTAFLRLPDRAFQAAPPRLRPCPTLISPLDAENHRPHHHLFNRYLLRSSIQNP
jgi:hypothetical protein